MSDTPRLGLPQIAASQAQKHVTHNEALLDLDAFVQTSAKDRDLAAPPGSPANGDTYIVAAGGTGVWTGQDGNLAVSTDGGWRFVVPIEGLVVWLEDEALQVIHHSGVWNTLSSLMSLQNVPLVGVNTSADAVNKFAVKSNAILFAALEAVAGGNGDIQFKVNKEAAADTGSLLFQTGFSGRAEMGLTGNDDFTVKVSSDGTAFNEALRIDRATSRTNFGGPARLVNFAVSSLPSPSAAGAGSLVFVSDESGGAVVAFSDGANWRRVTDRAIVS